MSKKTITELLMEAKQLRNQEAELKAKMKAQKTAIATEYCDNMPEADKEKQIAEAEAILVSVKDRVLALRLTFKQQLKAIKADAVFARDILEFVNYKQNNSLPKAKNQFRIEDKKLYFKREGIKDITIDISKADWQKTFKAELKLQGINGNDRVADNIIYKATLLFQSNIAIDSQEKVK